MKIGIVYSSKTGVTKRLADLAAEQLRVLSHKVEVAPLAEHTPGSETKYDILIIGSYCDSSTYPKNVRELFASLKPKSRLASFVTHATHESGPYYDRWARGCEKFYGAFCRKNAIVDKGYFHCRGKPSFGIALFIRFGVFKHKKADWKEYKKDMNNYPGQAEIARFREFISSVVR